MKGCVISVFVCVFSIGSQAWAQPIEVIPLFGDEEPVLVTALAGGNIQVCSTTWNGCGMLIPSMNRVSVSYPPNQTVGAQNLTIWNFDDVDYRSLTTLTGQPCDSDEDCWGFGSGYLLTLTGSTGQIEALSVSYGDDYVPTFNDFMLTPAVGLTPSLIWLETRGACGGACHDYGWRALQVTATGEIRSVGGPYTSGAEDSNIPDPGETWCLLSTRAPRPVFDPIAGTMTVSDDLELLDDTVTLQVLAWSPETQRLESTSTASAVLQTTCTPLDN